MLVNRDELMTAMLNLLTNAQDAMPDGGQAFIDVENYMLQDKGIDVIGGGYQREIGLAWRHGVLRMVKASTLYPAHKAVGLTSVK